MLYTRKNHDKHLEAIEAAEACISAAIAHSEYAGRIAHFIDDYVEISEMFWNRCPITRKKMDEPGNDVRDIARVFMHLHVGCPLSGLESFRFNSAMERCKRKIKGKLFQTRMVLDAKNNQSKCDDEENHKQPCACKPYNLFMLSQTSEAQ